MSARNFAAWGLAAAAAVAASVALAAHRARPLTAAQVVERNAAARGGLQAWRKIETMAWAGRVEGPTRSGPAPFVLEQKRPNRTRFEITIEGQKALRVFDGTSGWRMRPSSAGPPEVQPYTDDELKYARGAPVIEGPLMDLAARGATIWLAGMEEIEGRKAYVLALRLASGGSYRAWVDAETFLDLRYDREYVSAQGRAAVSSVYLTDYRAFEGLQLPLKIETRSPDGKTSDRLVIEQVSLNPRLDDRTFAKPGPVVARHGGVIVDTRSTAPARPARPGG